MTDAPQTTQAPTVLQSEVDLAVQAAQQFLPGMLSVLAAAGWGPAAALLRFAPLLGPAIQAAKIVADAEQVHLPSAIQSVINTITPGATGAPSLN